MRKVFDTISDFAANAGIVLGGRPVRPLRRGPALGGAMLFKNGVIEETGLAAAVLNHPANGVAWLANKIAPHGEQLNAGDVVLAGSFTRPVTGAVAGDTFHADYGPLGTVVPFRLKSDARGSDHDRRLHPPRPLQPRRVGCPRAARRRYRIFDRMGWTELIYNHISLRVPGESGPLPDQPLRPALQRGVRQQPGEGGRAKAASSATATGPSTRPASPSTAPSTQTLPDAHCVMHVHTTPTMAVCCLDEGLSFTNFYAAQLYGKVAYHEFEGITVHRRGAPHPGQCRRQTRAAAAQPRPGGDGLQPGAGLFADVAGAAGLRGAAGVDGHGRLRRHP
jgi:hypothetical protein